MKTTAIILADGQGTRMKSDLPKVLHTIEDRPMVSWVIDTVEQLSPEKTIVTSLTSVVLGARALI